MLCRVGKAQSAAVYTPDSSGLKFFSVIQLYSMPTTCNFNHSTHLETNYRYERLQQSQFRLLTIRPGVREGPLIVSLRAVDLLAYDDIEVSAPIKGLERYEAVSYVWGDPGVTTQIKCNLHLYFTLAKSWLK